MAWRRNGSRTGGLEWFLGACLLVGVGRVPAVDQTHALAQAGARLQAIYVRGDFRAGRPRVDWLADGSGYVIDERVAGDDQPQRVLYLVGSGERRVPDPALPLAGNHDPHRSPDGSRVLETHEGRLVVRDLVSGRRTVLSHPASGRAVTYDDPAWSPDGRRVVFIERDATAVRTRLSLDDVDPSYPGVKHQRFARVGETIESLRVGVVEPDGREVEWIPLPPAAEGFYLGQVSWAGTADAVVIERFSRFRDRRDVYIAGTDGALRRVFHEQSDTWVEGSQGRNSGASWLAGGRRFIVVSEQDGWRHAYLLNREGTEVVCLTPGGYDIIERAAVDEGGGWFYFYASPDDATGKHLFRAPLDGSGTRERITPPEQEGTHHYDLSPDFRWAIHTWSTIDSPPTSELVELPTHRSVRTLSTHQLMRERLAAIAARPVAFERIDIGDGITLDAWMLTPRGFDPTKRYPVLVYVYGEPHAQTVLNEWGAAQMDFHRVVADQGYVVVSIDNRGTPAPKGAAWRRATFGSLGPLSTEEQEAGLKALARRHPFIDLSRVGIWGWSGGGSNTLNALFRKPGTYQVGIAVVPKPQPHLYNAWFQEIFMRTREVNPEGYRQAAPINFAAGLAGRLLIITGSGETNTHLQIIEGLVDRLIELGKPFDYMVYPQRDHGLREGSGTLVHVRLLILRYLLDNLPAGPR